jgi:hypothetical protein
MARNDLTMLNDQDQVHTTTIGQLLQWFNSNETINADTWTRLKNFLAMILGDAEQFYNNFADDEDDEVRIVALRIAVHALTFAARDINKIEAKEMVHEMGLLAHFMLEAQTARAKWDRQTVIALKKIRHSAELGQ